MVWTSLSPDGTKSVRFNTPQMLGNTEYTETTMNLDHYWNADADLDGHHKFAQMTQVGSAASPADPVIQAGIDLVYYCRTKTTTESPSHQDVQPFTVSDITNPQVMQLLGIRAMGVFSVSGAGAITLNYTHNLTSVSRLPLATTGQFRANFANALPSVNYLILGGAISNVNDVNSLLDFNVCGATALATVKSASSFRFQTRTTGGNPTLADPLQCWFVVFGG